MENHPKLQPIPNTITNFIKGSQFLFQNSSNEVIPKGIHNQYYNHQVSVSLIFLPMSNKED